uniref:Phospholipase B1, membrane-associated n=1 Tax=Sipha flava TaxID=143950 RepID=A0A2S2QCE3_9HEMI
MICKEIISVGVCITLMCLTATSTWQTSFLIPKWLQQLPDENLTGVPKSMMQLESRMLYPTRRFLQNMFSSQSLVNKSWMLQRTQRRMLKSTKPFCNTNGTRSATRPSSVHELRPGDIDVIGAVGDSLTVGTGSFSFILPQLMVDHRGVSWTGGGQGTWKEFLTLPNILKVFNPKLIGYAYGDSLAEERFSQFNVAEVGALSKDTLFMTKELVKRIKMDKRVNLNDDWKMISLMLGSNTICLEICYIDYTKYAEKHRENILSALLYIKENLPRTLVNIILSPNLKILLEFNNLPPICSLTHIVECPCLYATQYKDKLPEFIKLMTRFQEIEKEIVEIEELKDKEDFAVVLQTFTEHITFPVNRFNSTDTSYLSSDCFHFSQKGYARGEWMHYQFITTDR